MWIQISSGRGPDECELAVALFLKSYQNECKKKNIKFDVIDIISGNIAGNMKSVLLSFSDENDMPDKKTDLLSGTIQWICKSPYRPNHGRKNWFIDVEVFDMPDELTFSEKEVRYEAMRSSGNGGQNVNKVESAVRAIHLPTRLSATAKEERSQLMNKKLALSRLTTLIEEKNNDTINNCKKSLWTQHNELMRGNPIRVYEGEKFRMRNR